MINPTFNFAAGSDLFFLFCGSCPFGCAAILGNCPPLHSEGVNYPPSYSQPFYTGIPCLVQELCCPSSMWGSWKTLEREPQIFGGGLSDPALHQPGPKPITAVPQSIRSLLSSPCRAHTYIPASSAATLCLYLSPCSSPVFSTSTCVVLVSCHICDIAWVSAHTHLDGQQCVCSSLDVCGNCHV